MGYNARVQYAVERFINVLTDDPVETWGGWVGWITYILEGLEDIAQQEDIDFEAILDDLKDDITMRRNEGRW